MKHHKIGNVMTSDVVSVRESTPFKDVARLIAAHRISGLPVVDDDEKVVGVISETDLMARQAETPDPFEPKKHHWPVSVTRASRQRATKARARTAGQ
ncbi:MAG TPA: CBS domain-containing protein, partial [Streptomyces sp.]